LKKTIRAPRAGLSRALDLAAVRLRRRQPGTRYRTNVGSYPQIRWHWPQRQTTSVSPTGAILNCWANTIGTGKCSGNCAEKQSGPPASVLIWASADTHRCSQRFTLTRFSIGANDPWQRGVMGARAHLICQPDSPLTRPKLRQNAPGTLEVSCLQCRLATDTVACTGAGGAGATRAWPTASSCASADAGARWPGYGVMCNYSACNRAREQSF